MSRESISVALFNKIEQPLRDAGAVLVSRRLKHWNDVPSVDQPAVMVAQSTQTPFSAPSGLPVVWRYNFNIYIYTYETDPAASPATKLNILLDALEAALAPPVLGQKQNLGGTVEHCWISGAVETDEGVLGNQCMAIVPIEILLP